MGIEHYLAIFVDDMDFCPNRHQIITILSLFQRHGIIEQGFLQSKNGQAILSTLDQADWEKGVVFEIPIPVSFWNPMLKELNQLSSTIGGWDPASNLTIFGEATPINSDLEDSPLTRFILLEQSFGRGDLLDELEVLQLKFFEYNKQLVNDIEACISKLLKSGIIYA